MPAVHRKRERSFRQQSGERQRPPLDGPLGTLVRTALSVPCRARYQSRPRESNNVPREIWLWESG
eukprot:4808746-Alexandrium_andersonii.AAC.1